MKTARQPEIQDRAERLAAALTTARKDGQLCRKLIGNECEDCRTAGITLREFAMLLGDVIVRLADKLDNAAGVIDTLAGFPAFDAGFQEQQIRTTAHTSRKDS